MTHQKRVFLVLTSLMACATKQFPDTHAPIAIELSHPHSCVCRADFRLRSLAESMITGTCDFFDVDTINQDVFLGYLLDHRAPYISAC